MQLRDKVGGALPDNGGDRTGVGNQVQFGPAFFRDANAFGERARARYADSFSADAMAAATGQVYEAILKT